MKFKLILVSFAVVLQIVASNNIHITSDTVELDGSANQVLASGNVIVTQRDITLKSMNALYNQETQIAVLTNNVALEKNNLQMTCDKATAYGIENIITAEGNISINYDSVQAKAAFAHFNIDTSIITLTGDPIATQNDGYITGESIYIDLDQTKVTTKGSAEVKLNLDKL